MRLSWRNLQMLLYSSQTIFKLADEHTVANRLGVVFHHGTLQS